MVQGKEESVVSDPLNRSAQRMKDIATLANVSVSTVSRALAGSPLVAKDKRDYIIELARQQGYVVDTAARNLRLKRANTICLAIPLAHAADQRLTDPFFMEMICHLADAVTERGYGLFLQKIIPPMDNWLSKLMAAQRVDGLLVLGQSTEHAALQAMARQFKPMVVWGGHSEDNVYCTVGTDNRAGGALAVRHLIERGCKRVVYFGQTDAVEFQLRQRGWSEALRAAGLNAELVVETSMSAEHAVQAMRAFLQRGESVDGVFAASDVLATSALKALRESGLRVPDDVAVVGFDDIALAQMVHPSLSTVHQDLVQGARLMVDLLFKRLAGEETESVMLTPRLIRREST